MTEPAYNIAHVLPWPSIGGTELATLRIAQALSGGQFRHVAFCLDDAAPVRDLFRASGFETARYAAVPPSYRHPKAFLRNSYGLAREFKRRNVSVVHCSDLLAGFYAGLAGRLAGLPILCHVRCAFEEISRRDRSFLWPISKFAFVSRDAWEKFGHNVAARRGVVVYDGLDAGARDADAGAEVRREFRIDGDVKIVGMVARVAPAKDYATLARAARRVAESGARVRFMIVGDHSGTADYRAHYEEVKRVLADCGVADSFIFTGFREDVARLVAAMDVFVLSTHREGLPLVILEAMAQGVPVVATAVGGVPEVVRHGETGLLHAHGDDDDLAAQLASLLRDEARADELGEAGRRFVRTNFNREQFAGNMEQLYRELLRLGPARAGEPLGAGGALGEAKRN